MQNLVQTYLNLTYVKPALISYSGITERLVEFKQEL